jgi:hypothetical protein
MLRKLSLKMAILNTKEAEKGYNLINFNIEYQTQTHTFAQLYMLRTKSLYTSNLLGAHGDSFWISVNVHSFASYKTNQGYAS